MEEIEQAFIETHDNIILTFNYGSSTKLATQIEQGAPVDVYLSASAKDMNYLIDKGEIIATTVQYYAQNELVLVTHKESDIDQEGLDGMLAPMIEVIAIGEPENVPLGYYTKYELSKHVLWNNLKDKFVFGADARQVTTYVSRGNADLGIVYKSDAILESDLKMIYSFGYDQGMPIVYPGGIVESSSFKKEAEAFMNFITSEKARGIFKSFGFSE